MTEHRAGFVLTDEQYNQLNEEYEENVGYVFKPRFKREITKVQIYKEIFELGYKEYKKKYGWKNAKKK